MEARIQYTYTTGSDPNGIFDSVEEATNAAEEDLDPGTQYSVSTIRWVDPKEEIEKITDVDSICSSLEEESGLSEYDGFYISPPLRKQAVEELMEFMRQWASKYIGSNCGTYFPDKVVVSKITPGS